MFIFLEVDKNVNISNNLNNVVCYKRLKFYCRLQIKFCKKRFLGQIKFAKHPVAATIVEHLADVNSDIKWDIIVPKKSNRTTKKWKKDVKFTNTKNTIVSRRRRDPTVISFTQRFEISSNSFYYEESKI